MFRLINHFKPHNILELGTSIGISACYQFAPNKKANFITMEGCPETAKISGTIRYSGFVEPLLDKKGIDLINFNALHQRFERCNLMLCQKIGVIIPAQWLDIQK